MGVRNLEERVEQLEKKQRTYEALDSQINRIAHFIDCDEGGFTTWVNMDLEKMEELRLKLELFSDVKQNMEKEITALAAIVADISQKVDNLISAKKVVKDDDFKAYDKDANGVWSFKEFKEYAIDTNQRQEKIIKNIQIGSIISNGIMALFFLVWVITSSI